MKYKIYFDNEICKIIKRKKLTYLENNNNNNLFRYLLNPNQDFHVKQRNFDRREILRSTYSIPYDWLFPFGRNDNGIWENTHDLPLLDHVKALPKLLYIRILCGFKEPSGNAVIDIQRALGRYWMSVSELMSFLRSYHCQMFQLNLSGRSRFLLHIMQSYQGLCR